VFKGYYKVLKPFHRYFDATISLLLVSLDK
jgi:hypothetical protein